ncbi:MAG TPA: MauE/DoxX family redox-associated membrane protein [Ktedonosporobacter sp.]|nr:MauE/DoxX family redox-associated membrane protein [Ktedonosporobacter sp.]
MIFLIDIFRLLLLCIFIVAGLAKIADLGGSRQAFLDFGVPPIFAAPLSVSLPIAEVVVAFALIPAATAWWGALGAGMLLLLFIAAISFNLARGHAPDCHCFGRLYSAPVGWSTLIRTALLAVLAGFIIWYGRANVGLDGTGWLLSLKTTPLLELGAGILLSGLLVVGTSYLLRRQAPQLSWKNVLKRGVSSDDAGRQARGLPTGTPAPAFRLADLSGKEQTLGAFCAHGKPVLLIFVDPDCRSCNALLPQIARWQHAYVSQLMIVLLSRGIREASQEKNTHSGFTHLVVQEDREVALAYQAEITPAAVLVNTDGTIGSSLALGAQAIGSLIMDSLEVSRIPPTASGPRLRPDLIIEKQGEGVALRYLIIDQVRSRYWQCGAAQYALLILFTGELTPDEIVAHYMKHTHIRLRPEQLDAVLHKLEDLGFLAHDDHAQADSLSPSLIEARRAFVLPRSLTKRWRLFPAQWLLASLEAHARWLFSPGFLLLCAFFSLVTGWIVVSDGWTQGIAPIWSGLYLHPSLIVWGQLSAALFITALIHESAHGLTLCHFGRQPGYYGVGVSLRGGIFFYVEMGEIWRLTAQGQRIAVNLAGPLGSVLIGTVGALLWWILPRGAALSPWAAALMAAGVLTAVYNIFPFFRSDGYFALADWVQIPNLDRKAQAYLLQTLFRPFRRQQQPETKFSANQRLFLAVYGVFAWLTSFWLIVLTVGFFWWLVVTLVSHLFVR